MNILSVVIQSYSLTYFKNYNIEVHFNPLWGIGESIGGVSPQSPHKKEPKEHWDVYTTNVENQLLLGSESVVDNRRPKRCSDVILESFLKKNLY